MWYHNHRVPRELSSLNIVSVCATYCHTITTHNKCKIYSHPLPLAHVRPQHPRQLRMLEHRSPQTDRTLAAPPLLHPAVIVTVGPTYTPGLCRHAPHTHTTSYTFKTFRTLLPRAMISTFTDKVKSTPHLCLYKESIVNFCYSLSSFNSY